MPNTNSATVSRHTLVSHETIPSTQFFAHYFKSKKECYLIISTTNRPVGKRVDIANKAQAKRLAKLGNLTCWNF